MKKALQNPFVVGALAIIAVVVVFRSAFKQEPTTDAPVAEAQQDKGLRSKTTEIPKPEHSQQKIDAALAQWVTAGVDRNPFSSASEEKDSDPEEKTQAKNDPIKVKEQQLKLSAIWLDGKRRMAVINGAVVARGERFMEYEIVNILANQVILHGSGGRTIVGFPDSNKTTEPIATNSPKPVPRRAASRGKRQ